MKKKLLKLVTFILRRKKVKRKIKKRKMKPFFVLVSTYKDITTVVSKKACDENLRF